MPRRLRCSGRSRRLSPTCSGRSPPPFERSSERSSRPTKFPQAEPLGDRIVPSTVTVANVADARESAVAGVFRFTRTGDTSAALTVNVGYTGTAGGGDYDPMSSVVVFEAGSATSIMLVIASADGVYDPDETVIATVQTGTGYTVGTQNTATVTIQDNAAHTFTLSSNAGTVWYDIAWDQVDPAAATDTAALTDFTLVFAGQTFTEATANFTVSPVAKFQYGDFVGIKFTVEFASPVAGFEKLIVDNGQVTGVDAITHQPGTPVNLQNQQQAAMVIDFSTMAFPQAGNIEWTVTSIFGTTTSPSVQLEIPAGGTAGTVRDAMEEVLKGHGLTVTAVGDTRLKVVGPVGKHLKSVNIVVNTTVLPAGPKAVTVKGAGESGPPEFNFIRTP